MKYVLIVYRDYTRALMPYNLKTLEYLSEYWDQIEEVDILNVESPIPYLSLSQ